MQKFKYRYFRRNSASARHFEMCDQHRTIPRYNYNKFDKFYSLPCGSTQQTTNTAE